MKAAVMFDIKINSSNIRKIILVINAQYNRVASNSESNNDF